MANTWVGTRWFGLTIAFAALVSTAASADRVTDRLAARALELPSARIETSAAVTQAALDAPSRIVMLGTGTPVPDANRAGSGIALVHRGKTYLFDVGAGVVRNATIARYRYDIPALYPSLIAHVFITHHHSDHVIDLPELAYTLWWRRETPLNVWGPVGMDRFVEGMTLMMSADVAAREASVQPVSSPEGFLPIVHQIEPGVLLRDGDLTIEVFPVSHGDIRPAFGYLVRTDDVSAVISGDTAFSDELVDKARGVDYLFHEVISLAGLKRTSPFWQNYHQSVHTVSSRVAEIARRAKPQTLVLYHGLYYGTHEAGVLDEVREGYDGDVVLAADLDVFE